MARQVLFCFLNESQGVLTQNKSKRVFSGFTQLSTRQPVYAKSPWSFYDVRRVAKAKNPRNSRDVAS